MDGKQNGGVEMTEQDITYFESILGKKISSITIDGVYGITNIGLENDVHLQLKIDIQPNEVSLPGTITIRIIGEIVNVS